uniref:Uncharacterized protein n=1 Tax=Lepeophtheirus salmonis TaxID=72036 RepID=A0A0K2U851_LEPSM
MFCPLEPLRVLCIFNITTKPIMQCLLIHSIKKRKSPKGSHICIRHEEKWYSHVCCRISKGTS